MLHPVGLRVCERVFLMYIVDSHTGCLLCRHARVLGREYQVKHREQPLTAVPEVQYIERDIGDGN